MATPFASHILLIDDDEAFAYASARGLRAAGYEVSLAPDHRLALQILESSRPIDLMITDIVMPGRVNGFALARMARMRRLELKVLYMTAYDLAADEAMGKVLRKPVTPDRLVIEAATVLAADGKAPS